MKKQRFQYGISGYRWAPESFQVIKGLPGQKKTAVPLTHEERSEVGRRFLTEGFQAAVGYIKHIERKREHKSQLHVTYGFWLREEPGRYLYCPQAYCRAEAPLAERLGLFKMIRSDLTRRACRVESTTQCELDGASRPVHVTTNTVTADLSRPLMVWLRCA